MLCSVSDVNLEFLSKEYHTLDTVQISRPSEMLEISSVHWH